MMTNEEMRKDIESKIKEKKEQYQKGEITLNEANAYVYGYVSQALMSFIGKFETDITGLRSHTN